MTSAGNGDQSVNKKDFVRERFESLLKRRGTKGSSAALTREKLVTLIAELKNAKTAQKKVPHEKHGCIRHGGRDRMVKVLNRRYKNITQDDIKALHSSIKITPYKAMFGCAPRVRLSTTPNPIEEFDVVEDEQQFKNALTALTACSESKMMLFLSKKHL
ncbi:hypothetical protein NPIL_689101 [Nephila pilipes]|uniref:Uncharacterized protein n=1 Tax=Nephila pilipes TaxID=299642 RepID=A0A8X6K154_NEPPI|nr:hypothetical protein NPIL_689101 [Nephila pilipes]